MSAPTNLHRDLGRIEGKLDAVITEMRASITGAHTRIDKLEVRMESQENKEHERTGAVKAARWLWGALTASLGLAGGALGGHLIR